MVQPMAFVFIFLGYKMSNRFIGTHIFRGDTNSSNRQFKTQEYGISRHHFDIEFLNSFIG